MNESWPSQDKKAHMFNVALFCRPVYYNSSVFHHFKSFKDNYDLKGVLDTWVVYLVPLKTEQSHL